MSTDWTKPVYDKENGVEVFALRRPDGQPFVDKTDHVRVIGPADMDYGWWKAADPTFTNTPPVRDWESYHHVFKEPGSAKHTVLVRSGFRNGKPFAEVVE